MLAIEFNFISLENLWNKFMDFLPHIVAAVLIFAIGFWLSALIGKFVVKWMTHHNIDATIHAFVRSVIVLILRFVVILSALATLGVNVNSFIAALAAAGATAGIGLKDSIAQFASGIQILFNKPFKKGDYIAVDQVEGTVEEIRLMQTMLRTSDNKLIILPNSTVTDDAIINYTAQESRRLDIDYRIDSIEQLDRAKEIILEHAHSMPGVILKESKAPFAAVTGQDNQGIIVTAQLWCEIDRYWDILYAMQEQVRRSFWAQGFSMPGARIEVQTVSPKPQGEQK